MNRHLLRFLIVVTIVLGYTTYKAFQLWPEQPELAGMFTLGLFTIMLSSQFIYRTGPQILDSKWFQGLAWFGALIMGLWGTFILLSVPIDLARLVCYALDWQTDIFSPQFYLIVFAIAAAITSLGFFEVLRGPRIKQVELVIPNLHADLQGVKIAQISDLHVGPTIRKAYVESVVAKTNASNPDLIFITGDLADAKAVSITEHLAPLADLKARYGVFYVTGNHEYYWDAEGLIAMVRSLSMTALLNENKIVAIKGAKLLIAGVTDPAGASMLQGHKPDPAKAIASSQTTDLKILLAHRPEACYEAEPLGFDLQFSGHTHAGQFFPFNILVALVHKYYKGLNKHGRMLLYVNPGTGYWGAANRFAIASEISVFIFA